MLFASAGFLAILTIMKAPSFTAQEVRAAAYSRPAGCNDLHYTSGDRISRSCLVDEYAIKDPQDLGLTANNRARGKVWYRVGDDAIESFCGFGVGSCSVYSLARGKFVAL